MTIQFRCISTKHFPQINLNRQDGEVLLRQYDAATSAIKRAIEALQAIDVHGRDCQTLDTAAYLRAREQHLERLRSMCSIKDELTAIALDILKQIR